MSAQVQLTFLEAERKLAGANAALDAAGEAWRFAAWGTIKTLAESGEPFTSDDVVEAIGLPNEPAPNANNSVGGVFLRAQRAGLISPTGERHPSRSARQHRRRNTVWKGRRQSGGGRDV